MAKTKATVRRLGTPSFVPTPGQRIGNKNILNRRLRNVPFKLKNSLAWTKRSWGQKMDRSQEQWTYVEKLIISLEKESFNFKH